MPTPFLFLLAVLPQQQVPRESAAEELRRIGQELYDNENPYIGSGARKKMEQVLADPGLSVEKRIDVSSQLGKEYLKGTEVQQAITTLEGALTLARTSGDPAAELRLHRLLGLAYLRLAEQQNCVERHNAECCIFPLAGGALHSERGPAQKSREHYLAVLAGTPDDLEARWLLNITAMALGEYPEGVPEAWRLPPAAFASQAEFPRFHDIAPDVGVDILNMAGGVAVEDFDGDGWLDILTSTCDPLGPLTYFRATGEGGFVDVSKAMHTDEQLGGLNLVSGDYDNDGDWDALVLRGAWLLDYGKIRKSLLRNDGEHGFTDVTYAAGLAAPAFPSQAGVWADFDNDGWLDFYIGHESRIEIENTADYPSQLYMSRRDGTFENTTEKAGVANDRFAKGVCAGDYDNDGDLDLYLSNIGKNRLYRNRGDATFRDVGPKAGVAGEAVRHFACWFWDQDNDGWLDLWVNGFGTTLADLANEALGKPDQGVRPMAFHNQRDGTFVDRARECGVDRPFLPMGSNFGDLDNDGWLDIYLGTGEPALQVLMPNVLLWSQGGQSFLDVTNAAGMGHLQKGHGVSFADFDQDGDQDILHQLGGFFLVDRFHSALFENPGFGRHWIALDLVGTQCNRSAVGARLRLVLDTPGGPREIHRAAGMVSSFGGSPHRQEIGLGDATRIARLEVRWPGSKEPQVFLDLPLDGRLRLTQGKAEFERLEAKTVRFATR